MALSTLKTIPNGDNMKLAELKADIDSYAFNETRRELAKQLGNALDSILERTQIERVVLFGSYFSPKLQPNDVDIIVQTKDCLSYSVTNGIEYPVHDNGVHLRIMAGRLLDAFRDWVHGETVVIE